MGFPRESVNESGSLNHNDGDTSHSKAATDGFKHTFAPPDCSRRLNPDSLLWSKFSMTVQPLNAP